MRSPSSNASSAKYCSVSGVRIRPGQIALTRIPAGREVASEALRQPDHAVLRRRVGRAPREPDQAADGGDVHDHAAAALAHPSRGGLAAVERAAQVDGDHVVPLLGRHRVDVADLTDAGAVHEDVDAALGLDDLIDRALDVGGRADVAVDRHLARAVEAGHAGALAREALGDLAADPARSSRDQHDPVLQHPALLRSTLTP